MTATTRTRPPDVVGGIEVRQLNDHRWHLICPPGGDPQDALFDVGLPRKRNAVAVRTLLLAAIDDWVPVVTAGRLPDNAAGQTARAIGQMVKRVVDRAYRQVCLGCGYRSCRCGTDQHVDGPHYTTDQLDWFQ